MMKQHRQLARFWALRFAGAIAVALLVLAVPQARGQASRGAIVGRVTDLRSAQPLARVAVEIAGTQLITATGDDGRFRLPNVPVGSRVVTARRIGYGSGRTTVLVTAGAEVTANFTLDVAALALDEVVITGTAGGEQRRSLGNTVTRIDAADQFAKSSATTLTSLLNARAPGVNILSTTGRLGAGPAIQIRGRNSLSLGNAPLVYLDGVRINSATGTGPAGVSGGLGGQGSQVAGRLNDLNPEDIESIEVISGPAAATIYGTDAASGVIQVITKRGRAGSGPQLSFRMEEGSLYFRDAADRIQSNYAKDKTGTLITWNGVQQEADRGHPLFRTGLTRQYNVSASGGREDVRYYMSGGYENDYGIEPNNSSRVFTLHANLSTLLGPKTDIVTSLNFVDKSDHLGADVGASAMLGAQVGHSVLFPASRGFYPNFPPEVPQQLYDNADGVNRFTGSITATNRPAGWFSQRAIVGLDYTGGDSRAIERFAPADLAAFLSAAQAGGRIGQTLRHQSIITADYSGTAKAQVTSSLTSSTSLGGQFNNTESNTSFLGGSGFPASGVETVSSVSTPSASSQSQTINTTIGAYAQQQFGWRDRLFVTAAMRVDNNSAFGEDFKWVTYPKLSASWVASEESFWKWHNAIPTLRFRAAYGENGRSPNAFSALRTFSPIAGANAVTPASLGNPVLQPERAKGLEAGFEAGIYNRLTLDFTYFSQQTYDAIVNQSIAPSSGFSGSRPMNLGRVDNHGVEMVATLQAVSRRSFNWEISGNIGTTKDKIKDLGVLPSLITASGSANVKDYPISGIWSKRVVSADRDPTTKLATNVLCDGGPGKSPLACGAAPFVYLGPSSPTVTGAIANTINIGSRLRLYALTDFKRGNLLVSNVELLRCLGLIGAPLCRANYFPEEASPLYLAETPAAALSGGYVDQFYMSGNFLKLREVSASYTIPERWLWRGSNASFTLAARELHTWTNYRGLDPEGLVAGSDQAVTPPLQRIIGTLNLKW